MRRIHGIVLAAAVVAALPGCCGSCKRPFFGEGGLFCRGSGSRLDAPAPTRGSTDPLLIPPPAGGLPTPPPPSIDTPPSRYAPDLPPPVLPESSRSNKIEKKNGKELILPDPLPGSLLESPGEVKPNASQKLPSPAAKPMAGLTGFASVRDGVATGRKPTLDGYDSLQQAGYKTVIYLHAPGADVAAAKTVAEKRGLTFVAVPVADDGVQKAYEDFAKSLADATKPVYIFDDDGVRTGSLWYAHFRIVDGLSDDAAQVRAGPLGLRDAPNEEKNKLLAVVREYLSKR